jgi:hypothetical protein
MKMQLLKIIGVFFVVSLMASPAQAESGFGSKSKWGIDVERLQNSGTGDYGILLGFKHVGYFDATNVYFGYEIHAGSDRGGSPATDNLTYGGLALGFDGNYFKAVSYDFGVLVGYGFGNVAQLMLSGQSPVIQPTMGLGVIMTGGYRAMFNASYLYMPGAAGFSTWLYCGFRYFTIYGRYPDHYAPWLICFSRILHQYQFRSDL